MTLETNPLVGIIGLKKDRPLLEKTAETLDCFGVSYDLKTFTDRNAFVLASKYGRAAQERGLETIITSDRTDSPISNIVNKETRLPVIVIPTIDIPGTNPFLATQELIEIFRNSIARPAPLMSINEPGAINASLAAISILALKYPSLAEQLDEYRAKQTRDVLNAKLT